jgi:hypothetical protein
VTPPTWCLQLHTSPNLQSAECQKSAFASVSFGTFSIGRPAFVSKMEQGVDASCKGNLERRGDFLEIRTITGTDLTDPFHLDLRPRLCLRHFGVSHKRGDVAWQTTSANNFHRYYLRFLSVRGDIFTLQMRGKWRLTFLTMESGHGICCRYSRCLFYLVLAVPIEDLGSLATLRAPLFYPCRRCGCREL